MNKKFVIFVGIILLLTAGISFAALLDCYGKIIGTAEISGPQFYIGSATDETLLINEKSPDCAHFGIAGTYRTFKTKNLGGINFNYIPEVEFSVRAKVSTTTPQNLILRFGYYDTSGVTCYLCSATTTVSNEMENYTSPPVQCKSKKPTNVKQFFYEFQKGCENCDYTISKCAGGFYTKVKIINR